MIDILYDDIAVFHLMEYMETQGMRHILEFWCAAKNFQLYVSRYFDRKETFSLLRAPYGARMGRVHMYPHLVNRGGCQ